MKTKTKLSILSLSHMDLAGCGYILSQAINEHTDNVSHAIQWAPSYIQYPYEYLRPSPDVISDLWLKADVIHIHDAFNYRPPNLPERPTVITWHGNIYRNHPVLNNKNSIRMHRVQTVATIDLVPLGDNLWMPDTRYPISVAEKNKEFTVCHAPTDRDCKSTAMIIEACRIANVKLELIEKVTWQECLIRKSRCHILVDQFKLGYGCNAIEAWAMGIPVIANGSKETIDGMVEMFGQLPFVTCEDDAAKLSEILSAFASDTSLLDTYAKNGKSHYEKYHSPMATAARAIEYYHKAIELFWSREQKVDIKQNQLEVNDIVKLRDNHMRNHVTMSVKSPQVKTLSSRVMPPGESGLTLLRYVGGNRGSETYIGAITKNKYVFSSVKPDKFVDSRDAKAFLDMRDNKAGQNKKLFVEVR
jgi:hypothetical protein